MQLDGAHERRLGGVIPNFWEAPPLAPAALQRPADAWMSTPTRGEDGTVFGLVQTATGHAFVRIDERSGRELWRAAAETFLRNFRRTDAFRQGEVFPAVALTLDGGTQYLVTWEREFALLDRQSGTVERTGTFPTAVPAVAAATGACFSDGKFWIGVDDGGRGGGVWIDGAGNVEAVRTERPADCRPVTVGKLTSASPMQNARDTPSAYPIEVCGKYNSQTRKKSGNEYCSDKRSDAGEEREVMLHIGSLTLHEEEDEWTLLRMPMGPQVEKGTADFDTWPMSLELGSDLVFLDQVDVHPVEVDEPAAPGSFEPNRRERFDLEIELLTAIGQNGELRWTRALRNRRGEPRIPTLDGMLPWRSTLSHPIRGRRYKTSTCSNPAC